MLSTLPNLADRNFILGFFLPALLFVLAAAFLFSDLGPVKTLLDALTAQDLGKAAYLLLAVWLLAVLMLMLNNPLYRFLEGYYVSGRLAGWLKDRQRARFADDRAELDALIARERTEGDAFPAADSRRIDELTRSLLTSIPSRPDDVLPTAFGNAIRAFEVYPGDIYGADAIPMWLRLSSVMSKDFGDQVQSTRTEIDFFINGCFFSVLFAALAFSRATYLGMTVGAGEAAWLWPVLGVIAAYLFYCSAVLRAPAWGDMVKAAFDCYLPDLAKQLGYDLPQTAAEREEFWRTLSQLFIYRRDADGNLPFEADKWKKPPPKDGGPAQPPQAVVVAVEVRDERVERRIVTTAPPPS